MSICGAVTGIGLAKVAAKKGIKKALERYTDGMTDEEKAKIAAEESTRVARDALLEGLAVFAAALTFDEYLCNMIRDNLPG